MSIVTPTRSEIVYPDSDGQPMAENTLQAEWITTIHGNLKAQFRDRADVFVAMDNLWYPVEGHPEISVAPDVYVVFGRPPGHRGSYKQWQEDAIPPQVVFEILSPGNRPLEMTRKFAFYQRYGVEEYFIFDPDSGELDGWARQGDQLVEVSAMRGFVSPRLGIRFEPNGPDLRLFHPDGSRFLTFVELVEALEADRRRADEERRRADEEKMAREQAQQRADQAQHRADRLASKLRELGIDPNGQ